MRISYAIVFVSDKARAVSFYGDVVGLPLYSVRALSPKGAAAAGR